MAQPTPTSAEEGRLRRGAHVTLQTLKRFPGTVVQATEERVFVNFPGSENLEQQAAQIGANGAHLTFHIGHTAGITPDVAMLVFLNTPNATADTTTGIAGSVAFFEHLGHGSAPFRLTLTNALKQSPAPSGAPNTVTFVPVAFPGREGTPQVFEVTASLDLVLSTVERPT